MANLKKEAITIISVIKSIFAKRYVKKTEFVQLIIRFKKRNGKMNSENLITNSLCQYNLINNVQLLFLSTKVVMNKNQ